MKWRTATVGLAVFVLWACTSNPVQTETAYGSPPKTEKILSSQVSQYAIVPSVRVVLPQEHSSEDVAASIQDGTLSFNEWYRRPDLPQDRVPVQCSDTYRIGVYFNIERQNKHSGRTVRVRHVWTHSNVDTDHYDLDHTRRIGLKSGQLTKLASANLHLIPELKVDGVWSLVVLVDDAVLFNDSFELIGCSGVDAEAGRIPSQPEPAGIWSEN